MKLIIRVSLVFLRIHTLRVYASRFSPGFLSSIYASTANFFSSANLTIQTDNPEEADIGFSLLAHISPIEWSNVVLYGENKLNRDLVRR